ncbi:MAG: penicillin-binding protein 2 [Sediminimonas qiaohouensis]|uniref:Penicillin-binding protein 2 n=1 Tax=Sediminimonas qiaohouensis TaxID=552061 RepID=A0A7C9L950_9RHOB|nr:penicillin-binding protein 2 [Sediminimonas qiaohouensis]MTJ05935.1 penicillin-binding protein 2 [Sediminimonas qiaohouensis]
MIRTPLRPLARILDARRKGENPDAIERENLHRRHEEMRGQARVQAEGRLLILGAAFLMVFVLVGGRMALIAGSEPSEPRASAAGASIRAQRADILDRRGRILATNMETYSLYAQPPQMIDPGHAADRLAAIFPDLEREALIEKFTGKRKFLWIKRKISPEQRQAVHDIGDPGLLFGPREMRLYPNGALASHVLGGARFGREGVHAAEVVGVAGIEKKLDNMMRAPARGGEPVRLSLDLTVQAAVERVLAGGMTLMNAKGASAVVMDVQTGELVSIASLPDFDPNDRPGVSGGADSPLFNRAVQGVYELGSTFKIFAVAQAMDLGLITPESMIDTKGPLKWGKFLIRDFHDYGAEMTTSEVIVKSSNIGAARIAQQIGVERQQAFLRDLGLLDPVPLEIIEAGGSQPLLPHRWSELSAMTISYGHGLSVSPLHLATAYSIIANGGRKVRPTLLPHQGGPGGKRVMSRETAAAARRMLRRVVTDGTASFGEVSGYAVGGKTGTADKPDPQGGYYEDKTITTFASMFPADKPQYVLVVMLDEPVETTGPEPRRTAGWTAVPVAAEIIRRIAPLLGVRPEIEPAPLADITLTSSN